MKKKAAMIALAGAMTLAAGMTAYAGQWIQTGDVWRYLNDAGQLQADGWQWIDGKCYYFDATGNLLTATTTPDGYTVDDDGAWVIDGVVQTQSEEQRQAATLTKAAPTVDDDDGFAMYLADLGPVPSLLLGPRFPCL